jgi:glyoxylase-like metal-dependent hydrolase (beta-lactamase superfamily II)/ferredoxin
VATPALRLPENVAGDFYVDSTCIDCDACRLIAPGVFHDIGEQSAVYRQPDNETDLLAAQKALVSCPTASIGSVKRQDMRTALGSLPDLVDDDVFRCGYTSENSFGAMSYFIARDDGNVMIDSPRFAGPLVKKITERGGVRQMLLTHQDDVAGHAKYHERFGCTRVLHRDDVRSATAAVELQPAGNDPVDLGSELLMIPTPGHTKGHAVFMYRNKFLFTGDHLAWSAARGHLYAFRSACWYSWSEQIRSMEHLLDFDFQWVLPGHGRPIHLQPGTSKAELRRCVDWMKQQ